MLTDASSFAIHSPLALPFSIPLLRTFRQYFLPDPAVFGLRFRLAHATALRTDFLICLFKALGPKYMLCAAMFIPNYHAHTQVVSQVQICREHSHNGP